MAVLRAAISQTFVLVAMLGAAACSSTTAGPNAAATTAVVPAPPPATKPTLGDEAGAVVSNKVDVTFPVGGATLTPNAEHQLDLAARLYRDAHPVLMFTTGYADRTGDEYQNVLLSARRAEAVKRALVARGIPADRLLIQALGESELANTSNPDSSENRRVVITWRLL